QRNLGVSLNKLGNSRRNRRDFRGALEAFEQMSAISKRLMEADPGNAQAQRDFCVSLELISLTRLEMSQLKEALGVVEEALVIRKRLAAAEPANAENQQGLAVCWERVGDARGGSGDGRGAVAA